MRKKERDETTREKKRERERTCVHVCVPDRKDEREREGERQNPFSTPSLLPPTFSPSPLPLPLPSPLCRPSFPSLPSHRQKVINTLGRCVGEAYACRSRHRPSFVEILRETAAASRGGEPPTPATRCCPRTGQEERLERCTNRIGDICHAHGPLFCKSRKTEVLEKQKLTFWHWNFVPKLQYFRSFQYIQI